MSDVKPSSAGWMTRTRAAARLRGASGFTFIELLIVSTLLIILASAVMPLEIGPRILSKMFRSKIPVSKMPGYRSSGRFGIGGSWLYRSPTAKKPCR